MSDRDLITAGYHKGVHRTDEEDSAYGRRECVSWKEITQYAEVLPDLEEKAQALILKMLGYDTEPYLYLPYEPSIRALIADAENGRLCKSLLKVKAEPIIQLIRNDDMEKNGYASEQLVTDGDLILYQTSLVTYKELARERLASALGFEPNLAYSMPAEIFVRRFFQFDWFHSHLPFCSWDYRAVTIYRYRKELLTLGRDAANRLPLIGSVVHDDQSPSDTNN